MINSMHVILKLVFYINVLASGLLLCGNFYVKSLFSEVEWEKMVLEKQIKNIKNEISLLNAELMYMSAPDKIRRIAKKYLPLTYIQHTQVCRISTIPQMIYDPEVNQAGDKLEQ